MADVKLNIISKFTDTGTNAAKGALTDLKNLAGGPVGTALAGVGAGVAAGLGGATVAAVNFADQANSGMAQFAATTGIASEDLAEYKEVALSIFAGPPPLGESIKDVAATMGEVETVTGLAGDALEEAAKDALVLNEKLGVDLNESLVTASSLVKNNVAKDFDEAFDIIAKGMQEGVNRSGDLNDTLNEYAQDFGALGFDGAETLSLLNAGLEGGIFNTDKIGDSINEAFINLADPKVIENLGEIDQGFIDIANRLNSGEISGAEAFDEIITGLENIEDPLQRNQAGVEIFRSMWEDLGGDAIMALNDVGSEIESVTGATEAAGESGQNLGSMWEESVRAMQVAIEPAAQELIPLLGEAVLGVAQFFRDNQPVFKEFADNFENTLAPAALLISDAMERIGVALGIVSEDASAADVASAGLATSLDLVVTGVEALALMAQGLASFVENLAEARDIAFGLADQLMTIGAANAHDVAGAVAGELGIPGFATGGSFTVAGTGGTDSQLVAFNATPGERVTVETPGQRQSGGLDVGKVDVAGLDASKIAEIIRNKTRQTTQDALALFQDQLANELMGS